MEEVLTQCGWRTIGCQMGLVRCEQSTCTKATAKMVEDVLGETSEAVDTDSVEESTAA